MAAALFLLLALALQAPADPGPLTGDWLIVHDSPEMVIAIDEGRVTLSGDVVRLRLRQQRSDTPEAPLSVAIVDYDCAARRAHGRAIRLYRADGRFVQEVPERAVREAFAGDPGAAAGRALDATCHRAGWGEAEEE